MLVTSRFKFVELNVFTLKIIRLKTTVTYIVGPAGIVRVILPFYSVITSLKQNNFFQLHLFYSPETEVKKLFFSRALINLMFNHACFQNYMGLKTIGTGYRFVVSSTTKYLFIAVGLTHLLVHRLNFYTHVSKIKKKKRLLILTSLKRDILADECEIIRRLRPPDVYCGKGLRFFHERFILKEGKKQVR